MRNKDFWEQVRSCVLGRNVSIKTPFGYRKLTYADYTASGRGVSFIEDYIKRVMALYGNTHTEDDATGSVTSTRLRQAECTIKRLLNAGDRYKIIEVGAGTTRAVHRLQEILGVYIPPAGREVFHDLFKRYFKQEELTRFESFLLGCRPVVFVGPYEHHSNEVSWRECFVDVVEIEMTCEGLLDLADLEEKISRSEYSGRLKIGSFSAASNVTGIKTPVYDVAGILHRHGVLAFFDYAAIAPYETINMSRDKESYFDGIFFSPHKFLGGPGGAGILVIHERVYRKDLPPTCGAGGTVDFVNLSTQEYIPDIEAREKAGTPGILQTMKAALAMELKEKLDPERIERREKEFIRRAMERMGECPEIEIIGNPDPELRIGILSFNIKMGDSFLHPRFVVRLMNDLFGIQSRAGCSCAGPYGHRLLHISEEESLRYRDEIARGHIGIKPGWVRISFHFLITEEEFDFICKAVLFTADCGKYFLPLYTFDEQTGEWKHRDFNEELPSFGLDDALEAPIPEGTMEDKPLSEIFKCYLDEAGKRAGELEKEFAEDRLKTTEKSFVPFLYYGS